MRPPSFGFTREEFPTSHGATGRIVSVALPSFVVAGPDNNEQNVIVGGQTLIRRMRTTVPPGDIKVDDYTVVLGEPNESGAIQAKFVRLMPSNATFIRTATTSR